MGDQSRENDLRELEAALLRWRALWLLGDLQRRAYLEQDDGEGDG